MNHPTFRPDVVTRVTEVPQERRFVIEIDGEVDVAAAQTLRAEFARAEPSRFDRLIIDARNVTFLDCGGLRLLQSLCDGSELEARMRCPSPAVHRIVELVGRESVGWQLDGSSGDLLIQPPRVCRSE
jgi:anti-anti-sigma factor